MGLNTVDLLFMLARGGSTSVNRLKDVINPREAEGYSVELFSLSVRPSVRPSVCLFVCPTIGGVH